MKGGYCHKTHFKTFSSFIRLWRTNFRQKTKGVTTGFQGCIFKNTLSSSGIHFYSQKLGRLQLAPCPPAPAFVLWTRLVWFQVRRVSPPASHRSAILGASLSTLFPPWRQLNLSPSCTYWRARWLFLCCAPRSGPLCEHQAESITPFLHSHRAGPVGRSAAAVSVSPLLPFMRFDPSGCGAQRRLSGKHFPQTPASFVFRHTLSVCGRVVDF